MRWAAVVLVTALVMASAGPAASLPTPPAGPFTPRGPIAIVRDSEFTAANGVVGGSGTPADPFVISGWSFATSGTAIQVENVTAHFVIRENHFVAGTGVRISKSFSVGVVSNNQFLVKGTGVVVVNADARVVDNSFIGDTSGPANGRGVELTASNSVVEGNAFLYLQYGVRAHQGSPRILCNDIHDDVFIAGVHVQFTTNATIACNIITQCTLGIRVDSTIGTVVHDNNVTACYGGIDVYLNKDVTVTNNTVRGSLHAQLKVHTTSGNITGNTFVEGKAEGAAFVNSPVLFANNTIHNHLGVGVRVSGSTPDLHANVVTYNAVGISLEAGAVARMHANVMANNAVGVSIPYESRQSILNMSANFVNGVNVDGTVDASAKVFFYKAANVTIAGGVRDSGFSAGYYGSISAQGNVVLYEVDTATIEGTVIGHANVGVGIVNSFNVQVSNASIVTARVGVKAEVVATGALQVPPCVVSVKDTNITIPVDPPATVGVDVRGCFAIVLRNNISIVDIGIRVDGQGSGIVANNTVRETRIGLDIIGRPGELNISGNVLVANRLGARFSNTVATLVENRFEANTEAAARLERGSSLTMLGNQVTGNARGMLDAGPCLGPFTCSSVQAEGNTFANNRGDGLVVNGSSTFRGDVFAANRGAGARIAGGATLLNVKATGNGGDGIVVSGLFTLTGGDFHGNGANGAVLRGGGTLERANFTGNMHAGLVLAPTVVTAFRINASNNRDGIVVDAAGSSGTAPAVSVPALLSILAGSPIGGATGPTPFGIHRSTLVGNERDAIRAGVMPVDATHNFFGPNGPRVNVLDQVGAYQNGVSPLVRFVPYYTDATMTQTGPVPGM